MVILDSDLLIGYLRNEPKASKKLKTLVREGKRLKTTIFNVAELYLGAHLSSRKRYNLQVITNFIKRLEIIPFSITDALTYAEISANLKKKGTPIGIIDELIASIVINQKELLVTRNVKHFETISVIEIENWEE